MRARIKATGEVINVEINKSAGGNQLYIGRSNWDGVEYTFSGDEIEPINESINESNKCDWQQFHIQAAIAAMQGMVISDAYCSEEPVGPAYQIKRRKWSPERIAKEAVAYADFLIAELQKKGGEDENKD